MNGSLSFYCCCFLTSLIVGLRMGTDPYVAQPSQILQGNPTSSSVSLSPITSTTLAMLTTRCEKCRLIKSEHLLAGPLDQDGKFTLEIEYGSLEYILMSRRATGTMFALFFTGTSFLFLGFSSNTVP